MGRKVGDGYDPTLFSSCQIQTGSVSPQDEKIHQPSSVNSTSSQSEPFDPAQTWEYQLSFLEPDRPREQIDLVEEIYPVRHALKTGLEGLCLLSIRLRLIDLKTTYSVEGGDVKVLVADVSCAEMLCV